MLWSFAYISLAVNLIYWLQGVSGQDWKSQIAYYCNFFWVTVDLPISDSDLLFSPQTWTLRDIFWSLRSVYDTSLNVSGFGQKRWKLYSTILFTVLMMQSWETCFLCHYFETYSLTDFCETFSKISFFFGEMFYITLTKMNEVWNMFNIAPFPPETSSTM